MGRIVLRKQKWEHQRKKQAGNEIRIPDRTLDFSVRYSYQSKANQKRFPVNIENLLRKAQDSFIPRSAKYAFLPAPHRSGR